MLKLDFESKGRVFIEVFIGYIKDEAGIRHTTRLYINSVIFRSC